MQIPSYTSVVDELQTPTNKQTMYLESSRAPVDKLDSLPCLDGSDSSLDLLGRNIAAVEQAARHVLAFTGVALDHLGAGLEARQRHLSNGVLLVRGLLDGDEGRECSEGEMNTGERNQVGLELVEVHIQRAVEAEGSGDGGDDLGDQAVEIGVAWLRDT